MTRSRLIAGFLAGILIGGSAYAAEPAHSAQRSGDLVFHYGLVPAEVVLAHRGGHEERAMHSGKAPKGSTHLVVALFESTTGKRVAEAEVQATVGPVGGAAVTRKLEAMTIAGQPGFGGFFTMTAPGVYKLRFEAKRAGHPPASAEFEHRISPEGRRR